MKKSIVFIGSSAGDAKIAKVMSVLHDAKIDVDTYCISADDIGIIVKELKKYHKKMMNEPENKVEKKVEREKLKAKNNKPDKSQGSEKNAKKAKQKEVKGKNPKKLKEKKKENFKKLAKLTGAKTKKDKHKLKKKIKNGAKVSISSIAHMPLNPLQEKFDSLEDFFEFVDVPTN